MINSGDINMLLVYSTTLQCKAIWSADTAVNR